LADDDYEILPHKELEYLRHEVERLKKSPYGDTETGETLLDSMNNLTTSINRLLAVLETANEEMIHDYEDNKTSKRLERLTEQNEKLAVGLVAVGELVKEVLAKEDVESGMAELEKFSEETMQQPEVSRTKPMPIQPISAEEEKSPFSSLDTQQALQEEIPSVRGLPPPPKDTPLDPGSIDDVPLPPR